MLFEEYTRKLTELRHEYASAIREGANKITDDYALIVFAERESDAYRAAVANLISEYRGEDAL